MLTLNINEIASQIELEASWRNSEYMQVKNALYSHSTMQDQRESFNKSLLLLLYSHYEGFCKSAFSIYIEGINSLRLKCHQVNTPIRASSLQAVFDAYDQLDRKGKIFKKTLPDDSTLHRLCRRTEFIDSLDNFNNLVVKLDVEKVTDVESNLWPHVLKKILYRSGLNTEAFQNEEGELSRLVNRRNAIAHGAQRAGVSMVDFEKYENAVNTTKEKIKNMILNAASICEYLATDNTTQANPAYPLQI